MGAHSARFFLHPQILAHHCLEALCVLSATLRLVALRIAAKIDLSENLRRGRARLICRQLFECADLHSALPPAGAILHNPSLAGPTATPSATKAKSEVGQLRIPTNALILAGRQFERSRRLGGQFQFHDKHLRREAAGKQLVASSGAFVQSTNRKNLARSEEKQSL